MSAAAPLPTTEQEQRAKWDLLLADLEYRQDQTRLARAQHDQLLVHSDTLRAQRDRTRQEMRFAPWAIVVSSMGTGAALFAAAFAFAKLFQ